MATTKKNQLKEIMTLAWQFVKNNGFTMGEALKVAWMNFKLKAALKVKSVVFHFKKKDGTTRKAVGTTRKAVGTLQGASEHTKGTGKTSSLVQVFFDIEKQAWRSFNKWNLLSIG